MFDADGKFVAGRSELIRIAALMTLVSGLTDL
jgi:hypothetical protein